MHANGWVSTKHSLRPAGMAVLTTEWVFPHHLPILLPYCVTLTFSDEPFCPEVSLAFY